MALKSTQKILKDHQFKLIFIQGRSYSNEYFVFKNLTITDKIAHKIPAPYPKFGLVASKKKVGNAVKRNRAKRIMSEALRLEYPKLRDNIVGVFVFKDKILDLTSTQIQEELRKLTFLYK